MPLAKRKRLAGGNGSCSPNTASLLHKAGLYNFPKDGPSACRLGLELKQAGTDKGTPPLSHGNSSDSNRLSVQPPSLSGLQLGVIHLQGHL